MLKNELAKPTSAVVRWSVVVVCLLGLMWAVAVLAVWRADRATLLNRIADLDAENRQLRGDAPSVDRAQDTVRREQALEDREGRQGHAPFVPQAAQIPPLPPPFQFAQFNEERVRKILADQKEAPQSQQTDQGEIHLDGKQSKRVINGRVTLDRGAMTVVAGASLTTSPNQGDSTRLARGEAVAIVEGVGSSWIIGGNLEIGDAGQAHIAILNGAHVESKGGRTRVSGGNSTAFVSGPRAQWHVFGDFEVGDSGPGHINIQSGAVVASGLTGRRSRISGAGSGGPSTGRVAGEGTRWEIGGDYEIGDSGEAHLLIESGGEVACGTGGRTRIVSKGSTVTVRGPGSRWHVHSDVQVGTFGSVVLRILDRGQVIVDGEYRQSGDSWLVVTGDKTSRKLLVNGRANLSGGLAIRDSDVTVYRTGDRIDVAEFLSCSGKFAALDLPPLEVGLRWEIEYQATKVALVVSDET